ncbi:alcohol dehydrogenase [Aureimonas flava]|uniref:Alcohol dehydrogenase n=1 Tax=Aureimonas flava TaxID=2320271 RepID=A0A3A1WH69_9HYPH|nr:alcohol dehydrogenase catalytic domain-containing protein [Aureimonas flava]RIX98498.1 alcohol dehydrogenase [Aureimonas flava]
MLALQKTRPSPGFELREVPEPGVPADGEVLIRVHCAGICGTDLHIAEWTAGYESMGAAMPVTLGHEFSGIVERTGAGVPASMTGLRVTVRPSTTCGRCARCRSGHADDCTGRVGIGIGRAGAFASLVRAPAANCHALPDGLAMDVAALCEPMTVCAEAVATAEVAPGQKILVVGPGFIGQGIALLARAAGAEVVVLGREDAPRLEALRALGFRALVDTRDVELREALAPLAPFDAVIEAAGVPSLVAACLPFLRKRGIFTVVGIHPRPAEIDLTALVRAHQQIRGSYRAPPRTWDAVLAFLGDNQDTMRRLVSHNIALADAADGFEAARSRRASKVLFHLGNRP